MRNHCAPQIDVRSRISWLVDRPPRVAPHVLKSYRPHEQHEIPLHSQSAKSTIHGRTNPGHTTEVQNRSHTAIVTKFLVSACCSIHQHLRRCQLWRQSQHALEDPGPELTSHSGLGAPHWLAPSTINTIHQAHCMAELQWI